MTGLAQLVVSCKHSANLCWIGNYLKDPKTWSEAARNSFGDLKRVAGASVLGGLIGAGTSFYQAGTLEVFYLLVGAGALSLFAAMVILGMRGWLWYWPW